MRLLLSALALVLLFSFDPTAADALHEGGEGIGEQHLENAFPNLVFEQPVFLTHAGDGSDRVFVVEQAGRIFVFPNDPDVEEAQLFLDVRERVHDGHMEEGLLGLAFAPDFASSGHFYVYYTAHSPRRSVLSRFSVEPDDPDVADLGSEMVVLEQPQPDRIHNAGMIAFGPDGYLYVAFGDGGPGRDPEDQGQNPETWLGAIIRIDVRDATPDAPYRVPDDNPFVGDPDATPEVWAYGFRNPWRFSFDKDGRLWVGDVGQNHWEEINLVEPGKNYGWKVMEGRECFVANPNCDPEGLELPVYTYHPYDEGCAVTGGYVYRGFRVSALRGMYIFGDWCSGRAFALHYDGTESAEAERLFEWWGDIMISSFGEDEAGELYMVDHKEGGIYWFAENDPQVPPDPTPTPTPAAGDPDAGS